MKHIFILTFCLFMPWLLSAQEAEQRKEVGIIFGNLDNFGFTYRTGTEKCLWRFNGLSVNGRSMEQTADSSVWDEGTIGFNLAVGREYRTKLSGDLEFRYGADLSFIYSQQTTDRDDLSWMDRDRNQEWTNYGSGILLLFGFNYLIGEKLLFGAELQPHFTYIFGKQTERNQYSDEVQEKSTESSVFNYGFSSSSVKLSLVYRL
ncbi:MAG: hypothetical protein KFH87_08045 [Bacteroidetes bacterium]|nr:hypothetical protein [Bacteroidota bacterium]